MADNYSAAWAVEFLARTMDATGRRDTAAYLFGAREAMVGVHMWTENDAEREERTTAVSRLHAALGPEEFDRLFTEGRGARSIDDVVRRLRADGPGPPGATHDAPG
jgi:hypothetical protein